MASLADSTNTKKRKSDASTSRGAKRARTGAAALADAILADPDAYEVPEDKDAARKLLVNLAEYAKSLENAIAAGGSVVQPKSKEELETAAEKVRKAAVSGIKKQMKWRDSCRNGTAKWSYDGICPDSLVFGILMKLGGPPKFKTKKISREDFEDLIGDITVPIRYDTLSTISKEVNVHWKDSGEFKFSGTYGK